MDIGDQVRLKAACKCRMTLLLDCYHRTCEVRHVFRDQQSVWIRNRNGWARRTRMKDLVKVNG